jgi:hypothetical protein
MTTKEKKCADLIDDRMKEREQQIKELLSNPDSDDLYDPALSVDSEKITTICLSWGGPSDYLKVTHIGLEIYRVVYEYHDWYDGATREVLEDSPLYEYAAYILESDSANYE